MQTNKKTNDQSAGVEEERDLELENIMGNLMIAQYQVDKLRSRLAERVGGYGAEAKKRASSHIFKHNDRWYKLTVRVDETSVTRDIPDEIKE